MNGTRAAPRRFTRAFAVALGVLVLAFLADTATTLAAGPEGRVNDANPWVRNLSAAGYLAASAFRLAAAAAIMVLFWPRRLQMRAWVARRGPWLAVVVPFSFRSSREYLLSCLVCMVGPLKLAAAVSNALLLYGPYGPLSRWLTFLCGLALGVLASGALLLWQHALQTPEVDIQTRRR